MTITSGDSRLIAFDHAACAASFASFLGQITQNASTAQRDAWPEADIRVVESIARRWYAVRDKGGN